LMAGKAAADVEEMGDEEVVGEALCALRQVRVCACVNTSVSVSLCLCV